MGAGGPMGFIVVGVALAVAGWKVESWWILALGLAAALLGLGGLLL